MQNGNAKLGIIFLGLTALVALIGGIWIVLETEKSVPDFLVGAVSLCLGALAGLLAPRSMGNG